MASVGDIRIKTDLERDLSLLLTVLAQICSERACIPGDGATARIILDILRLRTDRTNPRDIFRQGGGNAGTRKGTRGIIAQTRKRRVGAGVGLWWGGRA